MKQQFLPRSLRLRLGLVEAASGSRDAQAPAGCSAPQFSAMAVLDIHMEAASVADYLRKHNLTETLAVFLKEAKLAEQQNEVTNSADAAVNNTTAPAATTTGKSSKKRKPVSEGKGPDPVVLESVFNALAAGTVETKPSKSAAGAVKNGEKMKKKRGAKEDDKKGKDAHPAEGGGDGLQKDEEQQDAAKSSAAVATVSKEAPASMGAAEEALVQETPSKEQKKRKKTKASRGAPSEPEPAVEELLQVAATKEQEQAADKPVDDTCSGGGDVAQTAEKSSKKACRRGKKSANEDVAVATAIVDKTDAGEGGGATANAEGLAGADAETNGHVDVAALGTTGLIAGQPVPPAKGKGKKGKKDKTVAPEPEPTQAETTTTSGKDELVKDEHTEAATGDGSDAGAAAKTDASVIGGQDVAGDVVMEPSEPNAALEAPGTQGKKRGGKGKKEKKVADAENGSAEQDVVAADVGTVIPQHLGDVDMTPAEEAETEQQGIDTNGSQRKKKGGKKGKKGEAAAQEDKDAAAAAPGAVAGAHIDTNLADTTETIADQVGTSKATQAESQQTGSALPSAKKKGKKAKDRSAAPDEPAAADATAMAVEPAAPNGAEATDNKKRKRAEADAEADADAGEQHTVAGNGSAAAEGSSLPVPQAKKAKKGDKKPNDTAAKTFFQRVDPSKVEIADPRLQDNSYWAKAGADSGWGAKAEEVLGKVRGKDFRHEKTKKKRGSYKGGAIDLQSHSVKFNYDDE